MDKEELKELQSIKQLLISQLVLSGVSIRDIVKNSGMSSASIYKFLPKNLVKNKEDGR